MSTPFLLSQLDMKLFSRVFLLLIVAISVFTFGNTVNAQNVKIVDGNQDRLNQVKYTILNNMDGNPNASQACWRWRGGRTWGWGSWFNKTDGSASTVNTPAVILGWHWWRPRGITQLPVPVSNNDSVVTRARWTITGSGDRSLNVGYTMWFHDQEQQVPVLNLRDTPKVRIAVWLHDEGQIRPEGEWQEDVWVEGRQWELWRQTDGDWDSITFRNKQGPINDTEMELQPFIHYAIFRNWMADDKILSGVEFGSEVMQAEATMFEVDNFYVNLVPAAPEPPERENMYVDGRHLYSPTGERVVLRGVNEGFAWMPKEDRGWVMSEIAKSKANCVRIVWLNVPWLSVEDLDEVITQCIDNKMIPMIEMHDTTGDLDKVSGVVDFLTRDDVVQVFEKHKEWLILNIANEAGGNGELDEKFISVYEDAITRIRNTGVKIPLVIDATAFGQDYLQIFRTWRGLRDHDPENNLLFSLHTYWAGSLQNRLDIYDRIVDQVEADNIPLIFGEGPQATAFDCTDSPYQYGLQRLQESEIGWLAWSWGFVPNDNCRGDGPNQFDITSDGMYGNWNNDYGRNLIVDDPNSLENTSEKPEGLK